MAVVTRRRGLEGPSRGSDLRNEQGWPEDVEQGGQVSEKPDKPQKPGKPRVVPPPLSVLTKTPTKTEGPNVLRVLVKPRSLKSRTAPKLNRIPFFVRPIPTVRSSSLRRHIVCQAVGELVDDETFGSNEKAPINVTSSGTVDTNVPAQVLEIAQGCGGEVFLFVKAVAESIGNGNVRVTVDLFLYEGTTETPEDLDGTNQAVISLAADSFETVNVYVHNTDEGGDYADLRLTFANFPA